MTRFKNALFIFLLPAYALALEFPIPPPNGTYGVDCGSMALTDHSRVDPLAPKPESRRIMVSAFYPVAMQNDCDWHLVDYMPEKTAAILETGLSALDVPKGTLGAVKLSMCSPKSPEAYCEQHPGKYPLAIFSHGGGTSRLWHSAQAQKIASNGYTVITVDHPYDAQVVEFPDGNIVLGLDQDLDDPEVYSKLLHIRAEDMSFVLDQLQQKEVLKKLLPLVDPEIGIDTTNVPMYGHSAGGGAAAVAMSIDSRITGGLNLDGDVPNSVLHDKLQKPYMMFMSDRRLTLFPPYQSWAQFWPLIDNWKLELKLLKAAHGTFEDIPLLAHLLGFEPVPKAVAGVLGLIPGDRAMEIVTEYVTTFLKFIVTGEKQLLLEQPSVEFPEVEYLRPKK